MSGSDHPATDGLKIALKAVSRFLTNCGLQKPL